MTGRPLAHDNCTPTVPHDLVLDPTPPIPPCRRPTSPTRLRALFVLEPQAVRRYRQGEPLAARCESWPKTYFRTPDPPGDASLSRGIFLTPSRMTRYEIPMVYVTETVHLVSGTDHVNSSRIRSSVLLSHRHGPEAHFISRILSYLQSHRRCQTLTIGKSPEEYPNGPSLNPSHPLSKSLSLNTPAWPGERRSGRCSWPWVGWPVWHRLFCGRELGRQDGDGDE